MPQIQTLLSDEDVKNLNRLVEGGETVVDNFLLDNIGDMTCAETPSIEIWKDKKVFKYPVKTEQKKNTLGYVYIDPIDMTIIEELSDSAENIKKTCESVSIDSND